jgi:hypothetical protein
VIRGDDRGTTRQMYGDRNQLHDVERQQLLDDLVGELRGVGAAANRRSHLSGQDGGGSKRLAPCLSRSQPCPAIGVPRLVGVNQGYVDAGVDDRHGSAALFVEKLDGTLGGHPGLGHLAGRLLHRSQGSFHLIPTFLLGVRSTVGMQNSHR